MRLPIRKRSSSRCLTAVAATLALAGCGSSLTTGSARKSARAPSPTLCAKRSGFALSLVTDRGGQANPVAAATRLAKHGHIAGIPRSGWRLTEKNQDGATVASVQTVLHIIQGSDGTWQVDSGYSCS
jgi:hypothetical protein